jgi:DNA-binding sugar fermentation-stimulating protein
LNEHGQRVYLEVKNVPLADIVDIPTKKRKKNDLQSVDKSQKVAYFPDGYRKNKNEPISERAVKHVTHLTSIHRQNPNTICSLIFLMQRDDVVSFKPSSMDPIYEKALYDAMEAGVKILPICVTWKDNNCYYLKKVGLLPRKSV